MRKTDYTAEQKAAAVAELDAGGNAMEIAKRLGITTSGLYYWRKILKGDKAKPVSKSKAVVAVPISNGNVVEAQHAMRDATVFLRKAKSELMRGIKNGTIHDLDSAHLLSLLALQSLQGG